MRDYVKSDRTREEIIALNRASFEGVERAPDGVIIDIYNRGIVFTSRDTTVGMEIPPLMGAALVTTDDRRFNEPYIWMIAVNEKYRGCGVATSLLNEIACFARESGSAGVSLVVKSDNIDAIRLYLKEGFRVKRFAPGYYQTSDGLYMRRIV